VKARFDISSSHPLELFTRLHEQASFWDLDGYLLSSVPRPDMHWGVSSRPVAGLTTGISGLSVNGEEVEISVEAGKDTAQSISLCFKFLGHYSRVQLPEPLKIRSGGR
jgi:hypothetical protein